MNDFFEVVTYVNEHLYRPNGFILSKIEEEPQNAEYGAGVFQLNSTLVRFRVAKITPTKVGQFVAFWEKDKNNQNQAFSVKKATDLLVITTFDVHRFGQFVFPKEVLMKQNVFKTDTSKGKMSMRVYPSWEAPTSKQAIQTQKWQANYFVDLSQLQQTSDVTNNLMSLYNM